MKNRIIDAFCGYHPVVEAIYFVFMLSITMLFMHPVLTLISFLGALTYSLLLNGKQTIKTLFIVIIPMVLLIAAINPLFNHEGMTIVSYLGYNPITLESIAYGIVSAFMLAAIMLWFTCVNVVIDSDKTMYLCGSILPALSIIITMALRFVPEFLLQIKRTIEAQRLIGHGVLSGNIIKRALSGMHTLSIVITWALENAIITADSMRARGYGGRSKRTNYSLYRFDSRDGLLGIVMSICMAVVAVSIAFGGISYRFFPSILINDSFPLAIVSYAVHALIAFMPSLMRLLSRIWWMQAKMRIFT